MQEPVVVCSVEYDHTANNGPATVRMQNAQSSSFAIRLQSASPQITEVLTGRNVHCLAVEEGTWELPDGRSVQAAKYTNTVTDWRRNFEGEEQPYLLPFSSPIVVGQVMTSNDPDFCVFYSRGPDSRHDEPDSSTLRTGVHSGEYMEVIDNEVIGYIVMEGGIHADVGGGVEVESAVGPVNVRGLSQGTFLYDFVEPFGNGAPEVKVISQMGMKGSDGSWAVLTTHTSSAFSFSLSLDEDQDRDDERNHTWEAVAYVAISQQGVVALTPVAPQ